MDDNGHAVYIAKLGEEKFIAVSKSSPRFCLHAGSIEAAREVAKRALRYYERTRDVGMAEPVELKVVSPSYQRELLCA